MRRFIKAWAITVAVLWPICVSAESPDNDQVAHKVYDLLKASGRMSGSSFVIKCQDGTACLEGRVSSDEQKALALKLAGEVPEISEVIDRLHVEPSKKVNPVVKMLSAPFTKKAADNDDLEPELAAEALEPIAADEGSIYPEEAAAHESAEGGNLLVRQVANLRTVFHRGQSSKAKVAFVKKPQTRKSSSATEKCADCEAGVIRSKPMPRIAQVSNTKRYRVASRSTGSSSNRSAQTGRVRMVPMMEMADGSLVPVEKARQSPLGEPLAGQRVAAANRARASSGNRSRQSVARTQELIEGPLDAAPIEPMPMAPNGGAPLPSYVPGSAVGVAPAYYDQPHMPNYSWPSYAAHPNYAGLTYPRQYSPTAWPYIGPFYPYPQVPLGWRRVTLEWDDGWWFLDFDDTNRSYAY